MKAGFTELTRRVFSVLLLSVLFLPLLSGCARDDSEKYNERIATYLLVCPEGTEGCYGDCRTNADKNGNYKIDLDENPIYNTCTGKCDVLCDLTFLYLMMQDK